MTVEQVKEELIGNLLVLKPWFNREWISIDFIEFVSGNTFYCLVSNREHGIERLVINYTTVNTVFYDADCIENIEILHEM